MRFIAFCDVPYYLRSCHSGSSSHTPRNESGGRLVGVVWPHSCRKSNRQAFSSQTSCYKFSQVLNALEARRRVIRAQTRVGTKFRLTTTPNKIQTSCIIENASCHYTETFSGKPDGFHTDTQGNNDFPVHPCVTNCRPRTFWRLKIRDWFRANISVTRLELREKKLADRLRVSLQLRACLVLPYTLRRTFEDYVKQE
jgi:hypothetical protein